MFERIKWYDTYRRRIDWRTWNSQPSFSALNRVMHPALSVDPNIWWKFDGTEGDRWVDIECYVLIDELYEYYHAVDLGNSCNPDVDALDLIDLNGSFLGYDIADCSLISAITNCGYSSNEEAYLSRKFGPYLNRHHLFSDMSLALQFRSISNARVKEHAPFFVMGIVAVEFGKA